MVCITLEQIREMHKALQSKNFDLELCRFIFNGYIISPKSQVFAWPYCLYMHFVRIVESNQSAL